MVSETSLASAFRLGSALLEDALSHAARLPAARTATNGTRLRLVRRPREWPDGRDWAGAITSPFGRGDPCAVLGTALGPRLSAHRWGKELTPQLLTRSLSAQFGSGAGRRGPAGSRGRQGRVCRAVMRGIPALVVGRIPEGSVQAELRIVEADGLAGARAETGYSYS